MREREREFIKYGEHKRTSSAHTHKMSPTTKSDKLHLLGERKFHAT